MEYLSEKNYKKATTLGYKGVRNLVQLNKWLYETYNCHIEVWLHTHINNELLWEASCLKNNNRIEEHVIIRDENHNDMGITWNLGFEYLLEYLLKESNKDTLQFKISPSVSKTSVYIEFNQPRELQGLILKIKSELKIDFKLHHNKYDLVTSSWPRLLSIDKLTTIVTNWINTTT